MYTDYDAFKKDIAALFNELGIPTRLLGYKYAKLAVGYAMHYSTSKATTTKIYPLIAQKCDTTPNRVESAIRHAIETAWERGDTDKLNEVFGYTISYDKGRPTNTEFICACAEYLNKGA